MLIYEKNNKLNINFDNEISENPDLQIGKSGDKTEVLVDGSSNPAIPVPVLPEDVGKVPTVQSDGSYGLESGGGSGGGVLICTDTEGTLDKTYAEIEAAFLSGTNVIIQRTENNKGLGVLKFSVVSVAELSDSDIEPEFQIYCYMTSNSKIYTSGAKSEYPHIL